MAKIVLGIIFILAIFFGPAGTFNWPEAWIYLLMMVVYAVPTVLYLRKHNPELIKRRQKFKPMPKKPATEWCRGFGEILKAKYL